MVSFPKDRLPSANTDNRTGPLISIAIDIQSDGAKMSITTKADPNDLSIDDNILGSQLAILREIASGIGSALKI